MRKKEDVVIEDDGRSFRFVIEQMPATKGLRFGFRCAKEFGEAFTLAASKSASTQEEAFAVLLSHLGEETVVSLCTDLLACCKHVETDGESIPAKVCTTSVLDAVFVNPMSVFELLKASFKLNTSFFLDALPQNLKEKISGEAKDAV